MITFAWFSSSDTVGLEKGLGGLWVWLPPRARTLALVIRPRRVRDELIEGAGGVHFDLARVLFGGADAVGLRVWEPAINSDAAEQALEAFDQKWGAQLPVITQAWARLLGVRDPVPGLEPEVRRVIYATDESVKSPIGCERSLVGFRLRSGRGRPPSEAQVLGLMPAAQLAPAEGLGSPRSGPT